MKKTKLLLKITYILTFNLIFLFFCSCSNKNDFSYISTQTIPQLNIDFSDKTNSNTINNENNSKKYAIWIPVMEYEYILKDKSEEEFIFLCEEMLQNIKQNGYNLIYLHVRAYADAYYNSSLFPNGSYQTDTSYDVLKIITETAKNLDIEVHAWINPLRCMSENSLSNLSDNYILKQWYNDSRKIGKYLVLVNNNYWLNPAYEEVRNLICDGISEIIENYQVDGVHIDDFFYPTTDDYFDKSAFDNSNYENSSDFRLEQVNIMVSDIYKTIKSFNENIIFSISPQGTMSGNYDSQYSDVKKWVSEEGYCDVIIPQLYYGFENETCPFEDKVIEWENLVTCDKVSLYIGICTYKIGEIDEFAGSGSNEWCEDFEIASKEVEFSLKRDKIDGISIYSYTSTFHSSVQEVLDEVERIRNYLIE